jgi:hypothetical protein
MTPFDRFCYGFRGSVNRVGAATIELSPRQIVRAARRIISESTARESHRRTNVSSPLARIKAPCQTEYIDTRWLTQQSRPESGIDEQPQRWPPSPDDQRPIPAVSAASTFPSTRVPAGGTHAALAIARVAARALPSAHRLTPLRQTPGTLNSCQLFKENGSMSNDRIPCSLNAPLNDR